MVHVVLYSGNSCCATLWYVRGIEAHCPLISWAWIHVAAGCKPRGRPRVLPHKNAIEGSELYGTYIPRTAARACHL